MGKLEYIDIKKTAIVFLRDWKFQKKKLDSVKDDIESIESTIKRITPSYSEAGGSRSGNGNDDKLVNVLHKKEAILKGVEQAQKYMDEFNDIWGELTKEEQYILKVRFIENRPDSIKCIMNKLFISKPEAYRKCDFAINKFARLLYW